MDEVIAKALGLQKNGFNTEALNIFKKALENDPNNPMLNEYCGSLLLILGFHEQAKVYLKKALSETVEKPQVLNNLSTANRALGLFNEALLNVKSALKFKPNYSDAWINCANINMDLKKWDDAIGSYKNAIELDKDDKGPYLSLGRAYLYNQQFDQALVLYQKYFSRFKDVDFLIGELVCYRAKGDFGTAIEFAECLKNEYDNELMWFEWVQTLWMGNEFDRVKLESDKAIDKFGEYPALMSLVELLKTRIPI